MFGSAGNQKREGQVLEQLLLQVWRELAPNQEVPERIEALTQASGETRVFRLLAVGGESSSIIAKRCGRRTALVENMVYEELLPRLPLPRPNYYGCVQEPDGRFCWLFLEDVSRERYEPGLMRHRIAAGRWMGIMNTSALDIPLARRLPGRGPRHYLQLLQSARDTILSNLAGPSLSSYDRESVVRVVTHCDRLEEQWSRLAEFCKGMPRTLVHGDFITKNVGVRRNGDELVLLPFDWEKAGWGLPAEDISRVDISTYRETVLGTWPTLGLEFLEDVAKVGKIFRCLVFVNWLAPSLARETVEQTMNDVRRCETWLADLIPAVVWKR